MATSELSGTPIRATQRAPQSCTSCRKRRVKCNKQIPCQECIGRGLEAQCTRETVKVKGQIVPGDAPISRPSYNDLLLENRQLRAQLDRQLKIFPQKTAKHFEARNITESFERDLFEAVEHTTRISTVVEDDQIIWPSPDCAASLLSYGRIWVSWIHCALHHPTFEAECEIFWRTRRPSDATETGRSLWLAVYFSYLSAILLFMDEEEARATNLPHDNVMTLLLNWYDASLFHLYRADFLRNLNFKSVQAIAILGIVFNNVGDSTLHTSLWACGIRIARSLSLDFDHRHPEESLVQREVRRRLWWTFALCEWIPIPYRIPCVYEADFEVELPAAITDEELTLPRTSMDQKHRPIQYHIAMIQIATIYHRFRCALRLGASTPDKISALVIDSDESLANLIESLPDHLRGGDDVLSNNPEIDQPWIAWQKTNLSLVLLYYRIVINRALQDQWIQDPITFDRTRSICLGSARAMIALVRDYAGSVARHRPWATSLYLFSAAIILVVEARFHPNEEEGNYVEDIQFCVDLLRKISDQSIFATRAVEILKTQLLRI
ncbi:hypothetical protein BDZ45DRAFT_684851 [Acephala macrosclerotiorum]|nr:hypothetical protein BDZ45DRAFT_684851 [Acephala macrosclerotiorum]